MLASMDDYVANAGQRFLKEYGEKLTTVEGVSRIFVNGGHIQAHSSRRIISVAVKRGIQSEKFSLDVLIS